MKKNENTSKHGGDGQPTWAIRGIEPETRTAATMAARRAGQTVGEWCNRVLREAATERLKEQVPGPTLEETIARLAESMAKQAEATQQQNAAMLARLEAVEQGNGQGKQESRGNLLGRLYGLLRRPLPVPEPAD